MNEELEDLETIKILSLFLASELLFSSCLYSAMETLRG